MPDKNSLTLRQADQASPRGQDWPQSVQARIDFAAIESNLEFIMGQLAGGSDAEAVGALLLADHARHGVPCANSRTHISIAQLRK